MDSTNDAPFGQFAAAIEAELRVETDEARREKATSYVPSTLEVLGVPAPALRVVVRRYTSQLADAPPEDVVALAIELVNRRTHEGRQTGWEIVGRRRDAMALLDRDLLERLGRGNDNWASVDGFAVTLSGVVWRQGGITDQDIADWAASRDRWWRRTALVSTVPLNKKSRGGTGDVPRTLAVCERLAKDREPMVAKALSWALRDIVPRDRHAVERFLDRHGEVLPALVKREVRNKLETGRKSG
ncbi:MAG: DNA alkylation repair protein [Gemmatimonadota bacterium]|jgi:3-methyladenine DNA glycosylase AlkD